MIRLLQLFRPAKQEPDWNARLVASMQANLAKQSSKRSEASLKGWRTRRGRA